MNSKMTCFSMGSSKCRGPVIISDNMLQNYVNASELLSKHPQSFGESNNHNSSSHHLIVLKGLSHIVITCRCVVRRIFYAIPWPWKARRKEKDSGSGPSGGVAGSGCSNEEGKLYLESALLERHLNETELQRLVTMPSGFDENEWMASQTISLFEHVNLIYGTISEFCTSTSCPDMTGPCMRTYLWFDEKGKKVKVAAPQYVDYVMTFIQKTINDESIFPTKSSNPFPSSFKPIVKKICRLMFHVIAHIYHCHFKEIVLLYLHAHLNCVFAHFSIFNEAFDLVEEKETEILQDLLLAMKHHHLVSDNPMSDANKENIRVSKSSSGQLSCSSATEDTENVEPQVSTITSSSVNACIPTSEDSLLMKEPALVNATSDLH